VARGRKKQKNFANRPQNGTTATRSGSALGGGRVDIWSFIENDAAERHKTFTEPPTLPAYSQFHKKLPRRGAARPGDEKNDFLSPPSIFLILFFKIVFTRLKNSVDEYIYSYFFVIFMTWNDFFDTIVFHRHFGEG